jgi:hypothetical protein
MSGVLKIPSKYDICISQSWFTGRGHGISGHIYEIIDYYLLLKNHYNVCILLTEHYDIIQKIIEYKYDLSTDEIDELMSDTIFKVSPSIVICKNILIVDGYYGLSNSVIKADNIFMFACPLNNNFSRQQNHYILQDYRIYGESKNTINYIKKINFDRIRKPVKSKSNILLYGTKNCRLIDDELYDKISMMGNEIICITDEYYNDTDVIKYVMPPVDNLFELFNTYVYTPVSVQFDCSPRFIAECKYFGKNVIYMIDYEDIGLYWRQYDIDNNFTGLFLQESDEIVGIIGDLIG